MAKEFAKKFYRSKIWKDTRRLALARDCYTCLDCSARAEEVHHIIELTPTNIDDVNISLNLNNLQCLCHDCHTKRTKKYDGDLRDGYEFDHNGQIVPYPHAKIEKFNH